MNPFTGRPISSAVFARWEDDAACRTVDPELFFPEGRGSVRRKRIEQAKQVCLGCPVRRQCLAWSKDSGLLHGVAGAVAAEERWAKPAPEPEPSGPATTPYDRCLMARDDILQWRAEQVSLEDIRARLGVGRETLRKALRQIEEGTQDRVEVSA